MDTAHRKHPNYIAIWIYLAVLTVVEIMVAFMSHIPRNMLLLALVFLAVWKALLVALYFMHLRFEPTRLRVLAIAPLPLAFILVLAVITEFKW